jgi:hypothetical protein
MPQHAYNTERLRDTVQLWLWLVAPEGTAAGLSASLQHTIAVWAPTPAVTVPWRAVHHGEASTAAAIAA